MSPYVFSMQCECPYGSGIDAVVQSFPGAVAVLPVSLVTLQIGGRSI
jgi:hypothetical protein